MLRAEDTKDFLQASYTHKIKAKEYRNNIFHSLLYFLQTQILMNFEAPNQ